MVRAICIICKLRSAPIRHAPSCNLASPNKKQTCCWHKPGGGVNVLLGYRAALTVLHANAVRDRYLRRPVSFFAFFESIDVAIVAGKELTKSMISSGWNM